MKSAARCVALLSVTLASLSAYPAFGLNEPTHELINERAATHSGFDDFLKRQLGFLRGFEEPLRGHDVFEWLRIGGAREDDSVRFLRHFHDPLQPWERAGLQFLLFQFDSSIHWMQRPDQEWSWQRARDRYHSALTAKVTNAEEHRQREQAFADAFRALGQVMHLVVDASVPEHTRNDVHPLGGIHGSYEYWAEAQHGRRGSSAESTFINTYLSNPTGFDSTILRQPTVMMRPASQSPA